MVKVTKVAVWKIGVLYFEDPKDATREARKEIIRELMQKDSPSNYQDEADYFSHYWETIEGKTREAMAGT